MKATTRQRRAVLDAARFVRAYPLAGVVLWHRDSPRTSQRRAAAAALRGAVDTVGVFGGNRAGKTLVGAAIAVASAMGRHHPAVQLFARANRLDVSAIPERPGVVCCSALTGNDSIRVQRRAVAALLPRGSRWRNRDGHGESSVSLPPDAAGRVGRLLFKSNDQSRRSYQGDAWDLVWLDEEHSESVFDEARMRLVDRAGRALLTMTPLMGQTWVWRRLVDTPEPRSATTSLHSVDNPHIPQEYLEALLSRYGPKQRAARERGEFVALEGMIYVDWSVDAHVVDPFDIPDDWPRYMGIDFGYTNPTAAVWAARDPDGRIVIYREHHRSRWLIVQHAEAILCVESCPACWDADGFGTLSTRPEWWSRRAQSVAQCESCAGTGRREPEPEYRWADPENVENRKALSFDFDVVTHKAVKHVLPGIEAVAGRLVVQRDGRPRLVVFRDCVATIRSLSTYRWKPTPPGAKVAPLKRNDHCADAVRYLVYGLQHYGVV